MLKKNSIAVAILILINILFAAKDVYSGHLLQGVPFVEFGAYGFLTSFLVSIFFIRKQILPKLNKENNLKLATLSFSTLISLGGFLSLFNF